ncbi:DNA polymerase sliding clamp [Thermoplasmatales archaeon ex4484_30]|nr:MAG: DNA polymerase sliding clamp [Thermoplasmata archaeon]OYT61154.1 MAG: DNA polymerase sliding clamp [Thermoplasmatales archaeon ex4484_30]
MFQGKIKADFIKTIIDATAILVDEAKFKLMLDGVYGRTVDPAHVGMIDFKLKKEAFEEYENKEESEIGIDLEKLKGILKIAGAEDIVEMNYQKEEGRLIVTVRNITRKISLLDTSEMHDTKIPSLDLPAEIVVATEQIHQAIRAAEAISDHITLIADKDKFEMVSEGDTDVVEMQIPKEQLYSLKCEEKVKSMFPLDYLSDMIKIARGASDEITINLGNNYPVRLSFETAGGYIKIVYLLAPRIESE